MNLVLAPQTVPLTEDAQGIIRVGGTRVTLATVVSAFQRGATAEEIAQNFSPLSLADVYAAITYYLQNQEAVETYLSRMRDGAATVRRENEARWPRGGLRERLLARQPDSASAA